jgi:hypothetical protein
VNIIDSIERLIAQGVESALTLWPEWQFPILDLPSRSPSPRGDKDVENRSWAPPARLIGRRIALHWGAHVGGRKGAGARREGCLAMLSMARRAGWALDSLGYWQVKLKRDSHVVTFDADALVLGALGCIVEITSVTRPSPLSDDDPYYCGECGWRFDIVERLTTPIPCKGAQGLWPLRSLLGTDVGPAQAGRVW